MVKKILLVACMCLLVPISAFADEMVITSQFGWREHPISGEEKFHTGIDIAADEGSPIPALWDGQVVYAGWYGGYGNAIIVYYGSETYTLYGHCASLICQPGESVKQGQTVAYSGSTGNVTGPHVHLEFIQNGQYLDPMLIWQQ